MEADRFNVQACFTKPKAKRFEREWIPRGSTMQPPMRLVAPLRLALVGFELN